MGTWPWDGWFNRATPTLVSADEGYAIWARAYPARPHNALMEVEQAVVEPIIRAAAPRRALDVGTGTGRNLMLLAQAGARVVVGVDLSMAMLRQPGCPHPRVCGDACRLPCASGCFNLVSASLMAGDLPDLAPWLVEAARVLVPGGQLVYSDFHPSWAARGWRRTFQGDDRRQFELAYHPHTIDEHLTRIEQAGLRILTIREPRLPVRPGPVVAVFHAVKPGGRQ